MEKRSSWEWGGSHVMEADTEVRYTVDRQPHGERGGVALEKE